MDQHFLQERQVVVSTMANSRLPKVGADPSIQSRNGS
jgi:hypothetical protein